MFKDLNNKNILINVLIISLMALLFWYGVPWLWNKGGGDNSDDENYGPSRERSDTSGDWDVKEEVLKIRKRQEQNLGGPE